MSKSFMGWLRRNPSPRNVDRTLVLGGSEPADSVFAVDTNIQERLQPQGELGRGGMCVVHDAQDVQLLRNSALKVLLEEHVDAPRMLNRFVLEARITAQLDHPNIVPIFEFGRDPSGAPYLNMRKVSGETMESIADLDDAERLAESNLRRALRLLRPVCAAVAYAHSRGVMHLDLKPENIMTGEYGQTYVLDWGVAQCRPELAVDQPVAIYAPGESHHGALGFGGTVGYMAPEQVSGELEQLGPWTDVFLLGATLYHLVTGRRPHSVAGGREAALARVAASEFEPFSDVVADWPEVPPGLCEIVERAMSPKPADRFGSAMELRAAISALLESGWLFSERRFPAGALIIREGDEADFGYILRSGECRAFSASDGKTLRRMAAGDVFGEVALFTGERRTSNVEAVTDVVVSAISKGAVAAELGAGSSITQFVRVLGQRFAELDRELRTLRDG